MYSNWNVLTLPIKADGKYIRLVTRITYQTDSILNFGSLTDW